MSTGNHARFLRFFVFALFLSAAGCGVDPDVAWRQRTERQLEDIRAGKEHTIHSPHPGMLGDLTRDADITTNIEEIMFYGDVSSPDFTRLVDFPNLKRVTMYCTSHTDGFMKHLLECRQITELSIDTTDLSDNGVAIIASISTLKDLGINTWGDSLSTDGLTQLATLHSLEAFRLRTGPSKPDLNQLRTALPNCEIELEVER